MSGWQQTQAGAGRHGGTQVYSFEYRAGSRHAVRFARFGMLQEEGQSLALLTALLGVVWTPRRRGQKDTVNHKAQTATAVFVDCAAVACRNCCCCVLNCPTHHEQVLHWVQVRVVGIGCLIAIPAPIAQQTPHHKLLACNAVARTGLQRPSASSSVCDVVVLSVMSCSPRQPMQLNMQLCRTPCRKAGAKAVAECCSACACACVCGLLHHSPKATVHHTVLVHPTSIFCFEGACRLAIIIAGVALCGAEKKSRGSPTARQPECGQVDKLYPQAVHRTVRTLQRCRCAASRWET
jgi:hypothetical protein